MIGRAHAGLVLALALAAAATAEPLAPAPSGPPTLVIKSLTAEAEVFVDGEFAGKTPLAPLTHLLPGRHVVRVAKPGFSEFTTEITLAPGAFLEVHADLLAFAGLLTVESTTAGATAYLDGALLGPLPIREREVLAGSHLVEVRADQHRAYSQQLLVRAGESFRIDAVLEPLPHPPPAPLAAAAQAAAARRVLAADPAERPVEARARIDRVPITKQWWFYAAATVAAAGVIAAVVIAAQPRPPPKPGEEGYTSIDGHQACRGYGAPPAGCDGEIDGRKLFR